MTRRPASALIALSVFCFSLSACGGSEQSVTATTEASNTTSSTAAVVVTTTPVTSPPVSTPSTEEVSNLTDVRVAAQGTQDRVTFEFSGDLPGYSVEYVPEVSTGEQGASLGLQGSKSVEVRFSAASTVQLTGGLTRTYNGESRIVPTATTSIAEVAQASDYENVLTWGIGLREAQPFTISTLTNPARLVIDFG